MIITIVIFFGGCAASYRPINPPLLNYTAHDSKDGIGLSYKYDVLIERGNKRYAKKEDKKGIRLIAVKVTNNTDTTINVGRDVVFYSEQNQMFLMEPMAIKNSIKQITPSYLPYLLLTFVNFYVTNGSTTQTYPIGLILGPGITIGNMAVAGTANTKMLNELMQYYILNRDIKKGETVYGIIGVRDMGYNPISVRLREK